MGRRLLSLLLIVGLTLGISGGRPLRLLAEEEVYRAKVLRTEAQGYTYYVVFEYKGQEYRSDERDPLFNGHMWNFISPADKERVARNYAFGTNFRIEQFGATSAQIAQFGNDITGWTQAGETWRERMALKNYTDLNSFSD